MLPSCRAIVRGMHRLGYDVELKQFATALPPVNFRVGGDEHVVGSAWEVANGAAGGVRGVPRACLS